MGQFVSVRNLSCWFLVVVAFSCLVNGGGLLIPQVQSAQILGEDDEPASNPSAPTITTIDLGSPADDSPSVDAPSGETPPLKEETVPTFNEDKPSVTPEKTSSPVGTENPPAEGEGLLGADEPSSVDRPADQSDAKTERRPATEDRPGEARDSSQDSPSGSVGNHRRSPEGLFRFSYKGPGGVFHLTEKVATAHYRTEAGRRYLAILHKPSPDNPDQKFDLPATCEKFIYYIQEQGCGDAAVSAWAFSREPCGPQGYVAMKLTRAGWVLHTHCRRDSLCDSGNSPGREESKASARHAVPLRFTGSGCGPLISILVPDCVRLSLPQNSDSPAGSTSPSGIFPGSADGVERDDDNTNDEFGP